MITRRQALLAVAAITFLSKPPAFAQTTASVAPAVQTEGASHHVALRLERGMGVVESAVKHWRSALPGFRI